MTTEIEITTSATCKCGARLVVKAQTQRASKIKLFFAKVSHDIRRHPRIVAALALRYLLIILMVLPLALITLVFYAGRALMHWPYIWLDNLTAFIARTITEQTNRLGKPSPKPKEEKARK